MKNYIMKLSLVGDLALKEYGARFKAIARKSTRWPMRITLILGIFTSLIVTAIGFIAFLLIGPFISLDSVRDMYDGLGKAINMLYGQSKE